MAKTHHAIDYIELTVRDVDEAKRFYSAAFGWQFNDYGPEYAGIKGPDGEVGGLARSATPRAGGPLVILYSNDLEKERRGRSLGRRQDRSRAVLVSGRAALSVHGSERQRARRLERRRGVAALARQARAPRTVAT